MSEFVFVKWDNKTECLEKQDEKIDLFIDDRDKVHMNMFGSKDFSQRANISCLMILIHDNMFKHSVKFIINEYAIIGNDKDIYLYRWNVGLDGYTEIIQLDNNALNYVRDTIVQDILSVENIDIIYNRINEHMLKTISMLDEITNYWHSTD